jgi:Transposase
MAARSPQIAYQAAIKGSRVSMVVLRTHHGGDRPWPTSDARVLVGIDISKHRHEVLMAVLGKTRRRRRKIPNSTEDLMRLIGVLRKHSPPVRIGFEATGNSHRVLGIISASPGSI